MNVPSAEKAVQSILRDNESRQAERNALFNPITGEGSILERTRVTIPDFPFPVQYLPVRMLQVPLVRQLVEAGSVRKYLYRLHDEIMQSDPDTLPYTEDTYQSDYEQLVEQYAHIRVKYDFPFWASYLAYIKRKGGGSDCLFVLNRAQRRLVTRLEAMRIAGRPIRLVLLKARQWGGSTCIQLYMSWLQLVHRVGLNSLIVALQNSVSDEIKDMFDRMIKRYPVSMLHRLNEVYSTDEAKMVGVGKSGNIHRIPQRNCKIKIGSTERPDSVRGGDYNLIHCSEVGLWRKTDGKSPEDMVRSATSGVLYRPYTLIVYESTANGTGNFFQREYDAAKAGRSQFEAMFVPWFELPQYEIPFGSNTERCNFARQLWLNRNNHNVMSDREQPGSYLYWLWQQGATLEGIHWYIVERSKYSDHGDMAAEFPSDDEEAFVHSGARVFAKDNVNRLKLSCRPPRFIGDVYTDVDEGEEALVNLRFREDRQGLLWVWAKPEPDTNEEMVTERYLVCVDIGGRGKKADWSVITVFDRYWMHEGGKPVVVAQWYGHIDMDRLAWKAAQIAAWYNKALLVIESNTLETKDRDRIVDGDQAPFILNQIKGVYSNLYARRQSEEDIKNRVPVKYGFHTNVSTKPMIISTLVKVIREQMYVERDERVLDEYYTYERKQNGAFGAIDGKHDDLLMTRAIGLHICFHEMGVPRIVNRLECKPRKRKAVGAATI